MELDRVAADLVLENIRAAVPSRWPEKVEELRAVAGGDDSVTLGRFLEETGLELDDVYAGRKTFSDLRADAGLSVAPTRVQRRRAPPACGRLLHVDDLTRIETYRALLTGSRPPEIDTLSARSAALTRMLVASVTDRALEKTTSLGKHARCSGRIRRSERSWWTCWTSSPSRSTMCTIPWSLIPTCRSSSTRATRGVEILAAFGIGERAKVAPWQTGVYWAKDAKTDLFAFTLDKTTGQFSPTTRYRDYAISRELIHWESQSSTRADSETGLRYQRHEELGTSVHVVRPPAQRRQGVLVSRAGVLREPRVRAADGHHVAPQAPAARATCLPSSLRLSRRAARSPPDLSTPSVLGAKLAEWAHSWAQKSLSERACQGSSHGSRAGFTGDHAMTERHCAQNCAHRVPVCEWLKSCCVCDLQLKAAV